MSDKAEVSGDHVNAASPSVAGLSVASGGDGAIGNNARRFSPMEYAMDKPKRGVAIIINNDIKSIRTGSSADQKTLKQRFLELDFDVKEYKNLDRIGMETLMKKVALENHKDNDCFMCALLSNGKDGTIYASDGPIEIQRLIEPFKGHNCPDLAGKPKIFFIQVCHIIQFVAHGPERTDNGGSGKKEKIEYKVQRIPTEADFLIAYSGYGCLDNTEDKCSWFVQAISDVFRKYGQKLDLMTLMTRVNKLVACTVESNASLEFIINKKKIPCITSMLTKDVYFRPKN